MTDDLPVRMERENHRSIASAERGRAQRALVNVVRADSPE
jgi:hypothetical protein